MYIYLYNIYKYIETLLEALVEAEDQLENIMTLSTT